MPPGSVVATDEPTARQLLEAAAKGHLARRVFLIAAGLVLTLVAALASLSAGVNELGLGGAARALLAPLLPDGWITQVTPLQSAVLYQLRLPRTLMAIIGGAGLAMSGAAMQGITRNPLVSPYTVGISPAAGFGAAIVVVLGIGAGTQLGLYMTVIGAFAASMACAVVVLSLASMRGVTATILILAGVGLNYLFQSMTYAVQFIATEKQLASIVQWSFGSLNGATWAQVSIVGVVVLAMGLVLQIHAWGLNAFAAGGDEVAASLGFHVARTRIVVTVAAVLMTAAFVSFAGTIAFMGLVAPHIARLLIGGDHRALIPFSAVVGAPMMLIADMIGRLAFAPVVVPVGIVVAFIGVPLFLHLLLSRRAELTT